MTEPTSASLDRLHDSCLKCGRPTPVGVSLCELDNPARIKSPSTTQVHATILIGVIVGFGLLLVLFRLGSASAGTFTSSVAGWAPRADGGIEVVLTVGNTGARAAGASCRVAADGVPDFRDHIFFSDPIPAGETRQLTRVLPAPPQGGAIDGTRLAVSCT